MVQFLEVLVPLFAMIGIGYVLGRRRLLDPPGAVQVLNAFVYWVALPPLLFLAPVRLSASADALAAFLAAYGLSALAVFPLGFALREGDGPGGGAVRGMAASFGNTGYLGAPLFLLVYGASEVMPAALATLFNTTVLIPLTTVLMERARGPGSGASGAFASLRAALRNPLVIAPLAGIAVALAGLPLPRWLVVLGDGLGAATGPCALVAIGLSVASWTRPVVSRAVLAVGGIKLVLQPAAAALAGWLVGLEGFWFASAVLLAALPTGSLVFVMAQRFGAREEEASAVVVWTTAASLLSLPALFALL